MILKSDIDDSEISNKMIYFADKYFYLLNNLSVIKSTVTILNVGKQ